MSDYMYVSVNIWFLCFVIAAVCCCIHVCSVTGEISQRKRRRRAKTTELKQLFSKNYLNSPGGFKGRRFALFIPAQRPRIETSRIAFYVQRARLSSRPQSLHFVHYYADLDRVDLSEFSDTLPCIPPVDSFDVAFLYPFREDLQLLVQNFQFFVAAFFQKHRRSEESSFPTH